MRAIMVALIICVSASAVAKPVPNLVCTESRIVNVDPRSLSTQERESLVSYRFTGGSLYLTPVGQKGYRYNTVTEVEAGRYTTGHKVVQFEDTGFAAAILVHAYRDEVRVSRLSCKAQ